MHDLAQLLCDRRLPEPPPSAELRPRRPYPDGWFAVAFAQELAPGRVLRRRFMGEDLVLYRTRRGVVRVVEPYCPHLGAHLGHGGWVDGEEIVCPFHHFAFGTDGACVRTGYGTRPPAARLVRREVREVNGALLVWRHAGGAPPSWEVPAQPVDDFPAPFRQLSTLVDHPQDVVENAVDLGHIGPVHGYRNVRLRRRFTPHGPSFAIAAAGERRMPLGGPLGIEFDIVVHGLGHLWVDATIPRLDTAATFQAMATPIDPCRVELRYSVALRVGHEQHARSRLLASRLLTSLLGPLFRRDMERDFPIWQHKIYVDRPRLAKGDGPLPEFRRWARQFYSQPAAPSERGAPALSAAS
ncbi:MAG TPA: Rieske 2Fe-2S domain-containing protein [Conexibacter sp.]|nr:Rieske 2Fe-2S domain-containing protein [Conexibacter sp.]